MNFVRALAFLSVFALAACGRTEQQVATPQEPGPNAVGFYCGMTIKEHKGPKGQIVAKGSPVPVWFSSVKDALTYVDQDIVSEAQIVGFWVNDMATGSWEKPAPGSWIEARSAWYVVGSSKDSSMGGSEAVPFKDQAAANAFAKAFGGKVVDYASARREVAAVSGQDAKGLGGQGKS
jgi:copper chaperone NosL